MYRILSFVEFEFKSSTEIIYAHKSAAGLFDVHRVEALQVTVNSKERPKLSGDSLQHILSMFEP